MSDVTLILQQIEKGDRNAARDLLPLVYEELRKLAGARMSAERTDHTLQPTALVHEAYLRLVDSNAQLWESRGHFFAAAAEAMRRILIDSARAKKSLKRSDKAEICHFNARGRLDSEFPRTVARAGRSLVQA